MLAFAAIAALAGPDRWKTLGLDVIGTPFGNALLMLTNDTILAIRNAPTTAMKVFGLIRLALIYLIVVAHNLVQCLHRGNTVNINGARLIVLHLRQRSAN